MRSSKTGFDLSFDEDGPNDEKQENAQPSVQIRLEGADVRVSSIEIVDGKLKLSLEAAITRQLLEGALPLTLPAPAGQPQEQPEETAPSPAADETPDANGHVHDTDLLLEEEGLPVSEDEESTDGADLETESATEEETLSPAPEEEEADPLALLDAPDEDEQEIGENTPLPEEPAPGEGASEAADDPFDSFEFDADDLKKQEPAPEATPEASTEEEGSAEPEPLADDLVEETEEPTEEASDDASTADTDIEPTPEGQQVAKEPLMGQDASDLVLEGDFRDAQPPAPAEKAEDEGEPEPDIEWAASMEESSVLDEFEDSTEPPQEESAPEPEPAPEPTPEPELPPEPKPEVEEEVSKQHEPEPEPEPDETQPPPPKPDDGDMFSSSSAKPESGPQEEDTFHASSGRSGMTGTFTAKAAGSSMGRIESNPPPKKRTETSGLVKYACPRCKTPGMAVVTKVGQIVTCEKCGKALRLTLKK